MRPPPPAAAPPFEEQLSALQAALQAVVEEFSSFYNASLSVGVHGSLFGRRHVDVKAAAGANDYSRAAASRLSTDTLVPMGSATKLFSTVSVLRLAEAGVIDLDEAVQPLIDAYLTRNVPCNTRQHGTYCELTCEPQLSKIFDCGQNRSSHPECNQILPRCMAECEGYYHCIGVADPPTLTDIFEGDQRVAKITFRHLVGLQSGLRDYDDWLLYETLDTPPRDITPIEYLAHMDHGLLFEPGSGAAYSTNGFSLVGLALAGKLGKTWWHEVDQRELAWGHERYDDDRTTFPVTGTCLENACLDHADGHCPPESMAHQYFSNARQPTPGQPWYADGRPADRTFVDITGQSCLNSWMGGNVAARAIDAARFVYEAYSNRSVLLNSTSRAAMRAFHPITIGWGAGLLGYGLGTMVGADLQPFSSCGLTTIGHPGEDYGSGAPFNYYVPELDLAMNVAITSSHDGVSGMACDLRYSQACSPVTSRDLL